MSSLHMQWSQYIPHKPFATQLSFLMLPHIDALFGGAAGGGKALALDTPILTGNGWTTMEFVVPGDFVYDETGTLTEVLAISEVMINRKCYRVVFSDGSSVKCDAEHLWTVIKPNSRNLKVTLPTHRIRKTLCTPSGRRRYAIPTSKPIKFKKKELTISPYVMGMWLGDGDTVRDYITIGDQDVELIGHLVNEGQEVKTTGSKEHYKLQGLRARLVEYGLCGTFKNPTPKFIPNDFKYGSVKQRIELLQGLVDSDGHVDSDIAICLTNRQLIEDTLEIILSLGIKATIVEGRAVLNGKDCGPKWTIKFLTELPMAKLQRKLDCQKRSGFRGTHSNRYIVSVRKIKSVPVKCIQVASKSKLYLAGKELIPTHNSDVLLMGALQYTHTPGYSAIILRRSLTELKQSGALLDRASKWLSGKKGVKYSSDEHTYYFDTYYSDGRPGAPAKLQFGYLGDFRVEERYQGAEYQFIGIDEAGHFENDAAPRYLFSRLRKNVCEKHKLKKDPASGKMVANYVQGCEECKLQSSIPLKFRIACNPGGPGHLWIKQRYQITKKIITDPKTGMLRVTFVGADPNRPFIPSTLYDNQFIDQAGYETALQEVDEVRKAQLLNGDWDASPDSRFALENARFYTTRGEYYNLGGVVYHLSDLQKVFMTVDPAGSTKAGPIDQSTTRKGKSFTVMSVWGLTPDYKLIFMYMRRIRQEIPDAVDQLVEINKLFKPKYVKMESNGVGLGASQLAMMSGVPVVKNPKAVDKIENAANAIYRIKNHRVWFPEQAPWIKEALDEIFTWTGHPTMTDDIVDTLSDACNDVTWSAQGLDPIFNKNEEYSMPHNLPFIGADPHSDRQYQLRNLVYPQGFN